VRLTKVVETLRPRFTYWADELKQGRTVSASARLSFSPVALGETVRAICGLVEKFQPGIFHITGDESFTYYDAAVRVAEMVSAPSELVRPDMESGVDLFDPVPVTASLAPAEPVDCSGWRFSPSSATIAGFIRSL
jgi:dTDP-4-dehydrorhamnose reductase